MAEPVDADGRCVILYGRSGPWRLEASLERAYRALGWRVVRFDADPGRAELAWWLSSRLARHVTRWSLQLRRWGARELNDRFRRMGLEVDPDLVLLVNGAFVMPETVATLRSEGIPVAVFHPDAPLPGNSNHRQEHLPTAREADVCLTFSRILGHRLEERGARRCVYLPFAWDPEVFPHIGYRGQKSSKLIFIGGWDDERERWLEVVAARFELEIWGPDYWSTRTRYGSPLRDCWQGRVLRGPEASEVLSQAAISLNLIREQNRPDGTNMRTFEVPGAGGFQMARRTSGATEIFPEDAAAAYFESPDEMLEKIDYYLDRPKQRHRIARRAHSIVDARHRYVHRIPRIVSSLGLA